MHPRRFLFQQLRDESLDVPLREDWIEMEPLGSQPLSAEVEQAVLQNEEEGEKLKDEESTEYLQHVYEQIDVWLRAVQTRWSHANILGEFQRNIRFLTRILKQSRYPRLALIGRRGAGTTFNIVAGEIYFFLGNRKVIVD